MDFSLGKDIDKLIFGEAKRTRTKIPKHVKIMVWNKYIGADKAEGKCYVCGKTIHISEFEVGHNKAVAKGGSDNINNLRPICRQCNLSMGTMSIETFKKKYFSKKTGKRKVVKTKIVKKSEDSLKKLIKEIERDFAF